jgi:hypothetical protein
LRPQRVCAGYPPQVGLHCLCRYTFWTMLQLCVSPKTAYRHTSYHKQTKNHWARDDPAFVVVCSALMAAIAVAYCLA